MGIIEERAKAPVAPARKIFYSAELSPIAALVFKKFTEQGKIKHHLPKPSFSTQNFDKNLFFA